MPDDEFDPYPDPRRRENRSKKPKRQTAVALSDGTKEDGVPTILASGRGTMADKILQLAWDNGIKVRKDSNLAEMLATIDIDSPIPSEAFMAVAEILAYVYRANGKPNPFDTKLEDKD